FARAPLVPIALAATLGLVLDRYFTIHPVLEFLVAVGGLAAWLVNRLRPTAPLWLAVSFAGLAAGYHNWRLYALEPDDIGHFAPDSPTPARVRGTLVEEPNWFRAGKPNPLVSVQRGETTLTVLELSAIETRDGWVSASGKSRLTVEGKLVGLHRGDRVEVTGRLAKPFGASNPGERDYRSLLRDQGITATLRVEKSADGVKRIEEGWRSSLLGWFSVLRGWGTRTLQEHLPPDDAGLAAALLIGDTAAFDRDGWDSYLRTGVVHVLAISGQHLAVIAAFAWFVLFAFGVRRKHSAWIVAVLMIAYALLTGWKPSAVRAAVMVCVVCLAIVARRPRSAANAFALGWLVVIAFEPSDPFTAGCQLSFLSVFVLVWGASRWLAPRPLTPVEQLVAENQSTLESVLRGILRMVWLLFAVSFILGIANAPLILAWQNIVSPIGFLLGPPLIFLTSIALIAGFLLLPLSSLSSYLCIPFTYVTAWSLDACEALVHLAERIPGGWVYAPAPSAGWLVGFYLGVAALVLLPNPWPRRFLALLIVWVFVGVAISLRPRTSDESRFTFLAIGHGGCVVIETPDGRVLLYDAGTTSGPDAVRRVIAPYLWSRGITRIDEIFLSHADLDHFNGVPELLNRFAVGRVTVTPSFADRATPGVDAALAALDRHRIDRRVVVVGDRFEAGTVSFEVLHPPAEGPAGIENVRSMVLLARSGPSTILLTGDLEMEGQRMVRERRIPSVDVMLAPHHGGKSANSPRMSDKGDPLPGLMA
ncbi:MAG TPA: DNA internalization-related competence protein ComEC/Rec2, partial [Gemmata sp.]|nr:DNA internalization-related competence protein ComEC/Rec2 [Gemmata sp.]